MDRASMTTAGTGSRSAGMAVGWVICTHTTSFFHQVTPFWWWNLFYGLHTCVFLLSLNDSFPHIFHVKICSLRPRSALRLSHMTKSDAVSCYGSGLINSYSNWSDQTYSTMTKSDSGSGPLACTHTSFFHWVTPLHSFFFNVKSILLPAHGTSFPCWVNPLYTKLLCIMICLGCTQFLSSVNYPWTHTVTLPPDPS